jgi:hypothetical protein
MKLGRCFLRLGRELRKHTFEKERLTLEPKKSHPRAVETHKDEALFGVVEALSVSEKVHHFAYYQQCYKNP